MMPQAIPEWLLSVLDHELGVARRTYAPFNSPHEGYAVLLEEVDELWDEIKKKPTFRSNERMCAEAVQIAAMALRLVIDTCKVVQ